MLPLGLACRRRLAAVSQGPAVSVGLKRLSPRRWRAMPSCGGQFFRSGTRPDRRCEQHRSSLLRPRLRAVLGNSHPEALCYHSACVRGAIARSPASPIDRFSKKRRPLPHSFPIIGTILASVRSQGSRHVVARSRPHFGVGGDGIQAGSSALTGDEIKKTVAGAVFEVDAPLGAKLPISYAEDGRMSGEAGALAYHLGSPTDRGSWWISSNRLCQKWRRWFDGAVHCLRLSQEGTRIFWHRDDGEAGTASIVGRVGRALAEADDRRQQEARANAAKTTVTAPLSSSSSSSNIVTAKAGRSGAGRC